MGLYLRETLTLSPVKDNDTVSRLCTLVCQNTGAQSQKSIPAAQNTVDFVLHKGNSYSFTYQDVDGSNNSSTPSSPFVFTATDSTPPQQPDTASLAASVESDDTPDA